MHMTGLYKGPIDKLKNQPALLQPGSTEDTVKAHFDNLYLGSMWKHAWTEFPKKDFQIYEEDNRWV